MIGIDTNVLVRYLVQDDPQQAKTATKIIEGANERKERIYLSQIVICELVWVLESAYKCPKAQVVSVLKQILSTRNFEFQGKDLLWKALDKFSSLKVDFADALIAEINGAVGCGQTYTFDRTLKPISTFEVI